MMYQKRRRRKCGVGWGAVGFYVGGWGRRTATVNGELQGRGGGWVTAGKSG
jgi:hypothetical protein